jgi:hypothetical protein
MSTKAPKQGTQEGRGIKPPRRSAPALNIINSKQNFLEANDIWYEPILFDLLISQMYLISKPNIFKYSALVVQYIDEKECPPVNN